MDPQDSPSAAGGCNFEHRVLAILDQSRLTARHAPGGQRLFGQDGQAGGLLVGVQREKITHIGTSS